MIVFILIRVIKYIRLTWADHVARMEGRCVFKISTGKPTGRRPLGLGIDGRITLEYI